MAEVVLEQYTHWHLKGLNFFNVFKSDLVEFVLSTETRPDKHFVIFNSYLLTTPVWKFC